MFPLTSCSSTFAPAYIWEWKTFYEFAMKSENSIGVFSGPANIPIQKYLKAGVPRQQADCNLQHEKQNKTKRT